VKKKFKRNQMIITVLAIMIAAAGYLNYSERLKTQKEQAGKNLEASNLAAEEVYNDDTLLNLNEDIASLDVDYDLVLSEDDLLSEDNDETTDKDAPVAEENETTGEGETETTAPNADAASTDATDVDADTTNSTEVASGDSTPGEALFVSNTGVLSFVAEAKLSREQARAKSKETLLEIINNEALSESAKKDATDAMLELSEIAVKEAAAETLLAAKGFANAVVTIQDGAVDVVVNTEQLSDSERAQIEDIVTSKAEVTVDQITIVPLRESDE